MRVVDQDYELKARTTEYLKALLAGALKLSAQEIDASTELTEYGVDSFVILQLGSKLEGLLGPLPKTLLFEHQSIGALSEHICNDYRDVLHAHFGLPQHSESLRSSSPETTDAAAQQGLPQSRARHSRGRGRFVNDERMRQASSQRTAGGAFDVAVIGMSGRFPKARDLGEFWANCQAGRDCVTEIPPERWDYREHYDPRKGTPGKSYCKWGGFIDGVDEFDSLFFNISPVEAQYLDPQERLLLECVYLTLGDAGYARSKPNGHAPQDGVANVGVFIGVTSQEYPLHGAQAQVRGRPVALSGNAASIANRISYYFNFTGPSLALDTMCSSVFSALHLAQRSLRDGECESAIVGGVNLSIHPNKYLMLSQGLFASGSGRCRSFGAEGDGYVPGEGVGAVLLKPLSRALRDQDHIYCVIKGTAINHGGKTNGYTVPDARAQSRVVKQALEQANVDPHSVTYVEAHGTGTSLGDPIEVAALTQAFSEFTSQTQYCAIGSAKSNLGNLEGASGIAALMKVILQLEHGMLAPSIHSERPNPNIDFERTPFRIQTELAEWKRQLTEVDGEQREFPRIACLHSYGACGSNAHIVVAEHVFDKPLSLNAAAAQRDTPVLIVLSAKKADRLTDLIQALLTHVQGRGYRDADLYDIAFTLQTGREPMEHRLALTAATIDELQRKLRAALDPAPEPGELPQWYRGEVSKNKLALSALAGDADFAETIDKWLRGGKYLKVLELWAQGLAVDWKTHYETGAIDDGRQPRRVPLPTYVFARERHWFGDGMAASTTPACDVGILHPLVHQNTSDLEAQSFTSVFNGAEFFLSDHRVGNSRVLPGVAHLELARAAVERSAGTRGGSGRILVLKNFVWSQALAVNAPTTVRIGLVMQPDDEIRYEIHSDAGKTGAQRSLHSQGRALLVDAESTDDVGRLDVAALKLRCDRILSSEECYAVFGAMGIDYGTAHRALVGLHLGSDEHGHRFVLAKVRLPECVLDTREQFVLHPSIMDAAVQAAIGFSFDGLDVHASSRSVRPALPFALERLEILERTPTDAWVCVRRFAAPEPPAPSRNVDRFDIDICNEVGRVCIRLKGLSARVLTKAHEQRLGARSSGDSGPEGQSQRRIAYLRPVWLSKPLKEHENVDRQGIVAAALGTRRVWLAHIYERHLPELRSRSPEICWELLAGRAVESGLEAGPASAATPLAAAEQVFLALQAELLQKPQHPLLFQVLLGADEAGGSSDDAGAALGALFRSAAHESTRFFGQVIALPAGIELAALEQVVLENASPSMQRDIEVRYDGSQRYVRGFEEVSLPSLQHPQSLPTAERVWRDRGIYLITGGGGSLARSFAHEVAQCCTEPTIILAGRAPIGPSLREQLDRLQRQHPKATLEYRELDVTDCEAVGVVVRDVLRKFGSLHGVIHAAGILRDSLIIKKTASEFRAVLEPKIAGAIHLDDATRDVELDFFVMFSSIVAVVGNAGQSDYAFANAFMDHFASHRTTLARGGARHGKTVAINWPLWSDGGMRVSQAVLERLQRSGVDTLATSAGIEAFHRIVSDTQPQMIVFVGDLVQLRRSFGLTSPGGDAVVASGATTSTARTAPSAGVLRAHHNGGTMGTEHALLDGAEALLTRLISSQLKVNVADIDVQADLSEFGFDSISLTALGNTLNREMGLELTPTAFFEFSTVATFARYLLRTHPAELQAKLLGGGEPTFHELAAAPDARAEVGADEDNLPGQELRDLTRAMLASTIAQHLKVSIEDIDVDAELTDFGFDSIAMTSFANALQRDYGLELSPTILFEYPTTRSVAEYLASNHGDALAPRLMPHASVRGRQTPDRRPHLVTAIPPQRPPGRIAAHASGDLRPHMRSAKRRDEGMAPSQPGTPRYDERRTHCIRPVADATARLVIFHCFGFGESSCRWVSRLPKHIEVWTCGTTAVGNWEVLIGTLTAELRDLFDKPLIAWGHSMGSIVAFEVLSLLEREHRTSAKCLVISSFGNPSRFARAKYASPFYELDASMAESEIESRLVQNHYIAPRESGLPLISPAGLRNDLQLIKSYRYEEGRRLAAPLLLIHANNDLTMRDSSDLLQWETLTKHSCQYEEIEGTHLFFMNPPKQFINLLSGACTESTRGAGETRLPGVYRLEQIISGTEDMHAFPLGTDPSGYLIYTEDGQVAVHKWHRSRQVHVAQPYSPAEATLTYLAYAGEFQQHQAYVDHEIAVSSLPSMEGTTLRRQFDTRDGRLRLTTAPIVVNGIKRDHLTLHQKFIWERIEPRVLPQAAELAGTWSLVTVSGLPAGFAKGNYRGQCLVTRSGYVSVLISAAGRSDLTFRNPALAAEAQLQRACATMLCCLARIEDAADGVSTARAVVWQSPCALDNERICIERFASGLRIHCYGKQAGEADLKFSTEWRRVDRSAELTEAESDSFPSMVQA